MSTPAETAQRSVKPTIDGERWTTRSSTAPMSSSHQAVLAAVVAGTDPFQRLVWDRLNATEAQVADVAQLSAEQLGRRTTAVGRIENLIAAAGRQRACAGAAAELARRPADVPPDRHPDPHPAPCGSCHRQAPPSSGRSTLPGATAELQDLAATINESAASLRSSHGLLRDQAYTDALTGLPEPQGFRRAAAGQARAPARRSPRRAVHRPRRLQGGQRLTRARRRRRAAPRGRAPAAVGDPGLRDRRPPRRRRVRGRTRLRRRAGRRPRSRSPSAPSPRCRNRSRSRTPALRDQREHRHRDQRRRRRLEAADSLLRNADFSMYLAKGQGKNRLEVFAAVDARRDGRAGSSSRASSVNAAGRGQFVLHHQPVIDIGSGAVIGFEALVRWQHPDPRSARAGGVHRARRGNRRHRQDRRVGA